MSLKKVNPEKTVLRTTFSFILITVLCLVLVFTLSSCITIRIKTVRGSGDITTEEFEVSDFSTLDFSGIGKIIIEQGDKEALTVEAEDNIIDDVRVEVVNGRLKIGFKRGIINVIPTRDLVFHLSVVELEEINLSGAGNIECESLESDNLSISSSGIGNIDMNLEAENLEIEISGAGKVEMSGEVKTQSLNISGVGSYEAKELKSNDCDIRISGAGSAVVNVADNLDVRLSGIGKVEYVGDPSVTHNITGASGSVKKID